MRSVCHSSCMTKLILLRELSTLELQDNIIHKTWIPGNINITIARSAGTQRQQRLNQTSSAVSVSASHKQAQWITYKTQRLVTDDPTSSTDLKLATSSRLHGSSSGGLVTGGWHLTSPAPWKNHQRSTRIAPVTTKHPQLRNECSNVGKTFCRITPLSIVATSSCILPSHKNLQEHAPCTVSLHYRSTPYVLFYAITHNNSTARSEAHVLVDWLLHNCHCGSHTMVQVLWHAQRQVDTLASLNRRSTQTKACVTRKNLTIWHNTKLSKINSRIIITKC